MTQEGKTYAVGCSPQKMVKPCLYKGDTSYKYIHSIQPLFLFFFFFFFLHRTGFTAGWQGPNVSVDFVIFWWWTLFFTNPAELRRFEFYYDLKWSWYVYYPFNKTHISLVFVCTLFWFNYLDQNCFHTWSNCLPILDLHLA